MVEAKYVFGSAYKSMVKAFYGTASPLPFWVILPDTWIPFFKLSFRVQAAKAIVKTAQINIFFIWCLNFS